MLFPVNVAPWRNAVLLHRKSTGFLSFGKWFCGGVFYLFHGAAFFFFGQDLYSDALYLRVDQVDVVDDSRLKFDLDA